MVPIKTVLKEWQFVKILNVDKELEKLRFEYVQALYNSVQECMLSVHAFISFNLSSTSRWVEYFLSQQDINPHIFSTNPTLDSEKELLLWFNTGRIVQVAKLVTTREDGSQIALINLRYGSEPLEIDTATMQIEPANHYETEGYTKFHPGMLVSITEPRGILYELDSTIYQRYKAFPIRNDAINSVKTSIYRRLKSNPVLQVFMVEPSEKRILVYKDELSSDNPIYVNPKFLTPV